MPMYEYECTSCGARFDLLRGMQQSDVDITCTTCGASSVRRLLSLFASVQKDSSDFLRTSSFESDGGSCCSGGSCGCSFSPN